MSEDVYENPMQEYMEYLKRYIRSSTIGIWQAHQYALCREVAREYGVTEEELLWLD